VVYAAIIAAAVAIIVLVLFAIRYGGMAEDLGKSEADRDRLESELRELAEDENQEADALRKQLKLKAEELARAREEIARRRRRGDGLSRLRVLSETEGETPGNNSEG